MRMKQWVMAASLLCGSVTVSAQNTSEQFTIATLNVDGLPQNVMGLKVNVDGPGDGGTARIGKYLMQNGYDLVMLQEDFNYHNVLFALLEDDYLFDEWSGEISVNRDVDFMHLQNHRFPCDGLMACWKNDLVVSPAGRTSWTHNFGKFSHANDDIITKGYRRYDVTLRNGNHITIFNMHMDATDDADEAIHNDAKDTEARQTQWLQLKTEVLQQLKADPVIITGDLNSFYTRDNVKHLFIDAINSSGQGIASDVWVELKQNGSYPEYSETSETTVLANIRNGESLDKIIYINPVSGNRIVPVAFTIDEVGYRHNGEPLGDHFPVVATFQVISQEKLAGVEDVNHETIANNSCFDLHGRSLNPHSSQLSPLKKGIYIVDGQKKVIR